MTAPESVDAERRQIVLVEAEEVAVLMEDAAPAPSGARAAPPRPRRRLTARPLFAHSIDQSGEMSTCSEVMKRLAFVCVLAAAGCEPASPADDRGPCSPLAETGCVLPWPSSLYERDDAASPTGRRLDLPADVLPRNAARQRPSVDKLNRMDGWSTRP
jgi:hypothetical protein